MNDDTAWRRLADLLVHRRVELGYRNRTEFARAVGAKNDRIFSDLERVRRDNYEDATIAWVEQVYRWQAGSVRRILAGGDPTPTEERRGQRSSPDLAELLANEPTLTPTAREHIVRQFRLLQRLSELEVTPEFAREVDREAIKASRELTPAQKAAALEAEEEARTSPEVPAQEPKGRRKGRRIG